MAEYDPTLEPPYDGAADSAENEDSPAEEQRNVGNEQEEDEEDYDPSSFNFGGGEQQVETSSDGNTPANGVEAPIETAAPVPAVAQSTKPKTIGGFIVEDDDEDDEEAAVPRPPQAGGAESMQSGLDVVGASKMRNVLLASAPTTDSAALHASSSTRLNGSAATPVFDVTPSASFQSMDAAQGKANISANSTTQLAASASNIPTQQVPSSMRLPHDVVGRLEDRIKDEPKADTDAWTQLLAHYRAKDQIDNVRKVYERFLDVFPTSVTIWTQFLQLELEHMERSRVDTIFSKSLPNVPDVDLWSMYLDYLRRVLPLANDVSGEHRGTITQAFEAVLNAIGIDPDAGKVWRDYIDFIKSGPGVIGGPGWQDQQKGDLVRKAYQRAIKVPHSELTKLWKEYDNFEMTLNKLSGRKQLSDMGPHYMTARTAKTQLDQRIEGLDRKGLPVLPPLHGFDGEDQFGTQVELWQGWIDWEKTDPLVYQDDDMPAFRKRVLYVYKHATMQLRFYPQIWFDAAQWCFEQGTEDLIAEGDRFLEKGIAANPESVLLALKQADKIETSLATGNNSDEVAIRNGERLDAPYENVHKALYGLREKMVEREKKAIQQVQEYFASLPPEDEPEKQTVNDDEDDYDEPTEKPKSRSEQMQAQTSAIKLGSQAQLDILKRVISYVWVAKMRAFRRIQGQGAPNKPKKGFRGVFAEARPRGQLSSDVYIASALMEWHCYKDPSALKIFERGLKLFPTDAVFALEYIKHLIANNDVTNARVVFETTITKILGAPQIQEPQRKPMCRPLFLYMHNFESNYGDLVQIHKLEKRMVEMFPEEPGLARFSQRFIIPPHFDGMDIQLIISPTQARPKPLVLQHNAPGGFMPSIEAPQSPQEQSALKLGPNGPYVASPKRPLDDSDADTPQRKFMRGESPLKGAAGRRIQHNAANSASGLSNIAAGAGAGFSVKNYVPGTGLQPSAMPAMAPPPLPRDISFLLQVIPNASQYNAVRFDSAAMVDFLRSVDIDGARARFGR
ncbi:Hypothetical protein R9X50_00058200 [Acrodontium crateriforme]|uniref:mRNA 3'-end-processing protein RNA14 n=1 Tax=Acrodontium crateriforme TaxID=150365 RepID=A0AAQ3LYD5_9PEZI|nr:Hypothetical protein R9X50_00058200 [Acrodontium crateriforme]